MFRYLLSLLTNINLPEGENEFFETLKLYFPNIYDVKYLMKSCKNLKGGLQEVADMLEVERIGPQHQAGSDSLLTGRAFFKMTEIYFEDELDDSKVEKADDDDDDLIVYVPSTWVTCTGSVPTMWETTQTLNLQPRRTPDQLSVDTTTSCCCRHTFIQYFSSVSVLPLQGSRPHSTRTNPAQLHSRHNPCICPCLPAPWGCACAAAVRSICRLLISEVTVPAQTSMTA